MRDTTCPEVLWEKSQICSFFGVKLLIICNLSIDDSWRWLTATTVGVIGQVDLLAGEEEVRSAHICAAFMKKLIFCEETEKDCSF